MFDFNNVTNEIEISINKNSNVDLLTIPYVTDPLIIETLFFNLYKIIIKIKKKLMVYMKYFYHQIIRESLIIVILRITFIPLQNNIILDMKQEVIKKKLQ